MGKIIFRFWVQFHFDLWPVPIKLLLLHYTVMWLKGKSEEPEPLRGTAVDEEILWQAERAAGLEAVIEAISAATHDASLYLTISDTYCITWGIYQFHLTSYQGQINDLSTFLKSSRSLHLRHCSTLFHTSARFLQCLKPEISFHHNILF